MKNKLTLSLNNNVIREAKKYASQDDESISNLVQDFLETYIAMKSKPQNTLHHHAEKFAGIISLKEHSTSKETISDTIISKHSRRFK